MGYEKIYINEISDLDKLLYSFTFNDEIGRHRDLFIYRGLPDVNYSLMSSLERCCKEKKNELEQSILDNFAKYGELEDSSIKASVWRKMMLGQHHGLPTRLLDWSGSPMIALHFATTEADMDNLDRRDCVVWRLDVEKLHSHLPEAYRAESERSRQKVFSVDMLKNVCKDLQQYDQDMGKDKMVILEPPSMDSRMMNQYSFFSVVPSGVTRVNDLLELYEDAVVCYIINKNLRWQIRDILDQANINERIVYPGLDGIAAWIARHYFVRNPGRLLIEKINIADLEADVVVNSADTELSGIGMVSEDIYRKAGATKVHKACQKIGCCEVGDIVATKGYDLKAKYIIHAVAPEWNYSDRTKQDELLASVIRKSLDFVKKKKLHSIGFPLLSTGHKGYAPEVAWRIAIQECLQFLEKNQGYPLVITFCVINEKSYVMGKDIYNEILRIDASGVK